MAAGGTFPPTRYSRLLSIRAHNCIPMREVAGEGILDVRAK
jgi:hypothetical protein